MCLKLPSCRTATIIVTKQFGKKRYFKKNMRELFFLGYENLDFKLKL